VGVWDMLRLGSLAVMWCSSLLLMIWGTHDGSSLVWWSLWLAAAAASLTAVHVMIGVVKAERLRIAEVVSAVCDKGPRSLSH
jgi:hypothetical protein